MSDQFILRRATEKDYPAVKDLIFDSTNDWYQKNFKKIPKRRGQTIYDDTKKIAGTVPIW